MISIDSDQRLPQVLPGIEHSQQDFREFVDILDSREDLPLGDKITIVLYQASAQSRLGLKISSADPVTAIRRTIPNVERDLGIELNNLAYRAIRKSVLFDLLDEYAAVKEELDKAKVPA